MSTIIIILILILIGIYSIKSYTKKLTHGCCGGESDNVEMIKPKDKNKDHYPYHYQMDIEGMSCQNCKKRIENAFHKNDGFFMDIHLKKGTAILYTKQVINEEDIRQKIVSLGYQVKNITRI